MKSKGWKRFWVSLAASWFGTWAAVAAYANWQMSILAHLIAGKTYNDPEWIYLMSNMDQMSQLMAYAVWGGIFIPILLSPFWALAYWTYRGFKADRLARARA